MKSKRSFESYEKIWYLQPISNSFKKKIQEFLGSYTKAYVSLKNKNSTSSYGLKENVLRQDGSVIDLWLVDIDIIAKIHEAGYLEGYRVWCSRGGSRVEEVTQNIDLFIAPKMEAIPWIKKPNKYSRELVS